MKAYAFMVVLSIVLLSTVALADVPSLINYQGTLTDQYGVALDGTVSMTFRIYTDSTGGTEVWMETQSSVSVSQGVFNVLLGRVNAISDTVFKDPSRWLGITVFDESEMQPRQRIAAVGYAFRAAEADTADALRGGGGGSDGDWTIVGPDMYSAVSGRVGIGTASPQEKFHVANGNLIVGGSGVNNRIKASSGDATIMSELFAYDGLGGYVGTLTNHNFVLRTNDLDRVTINTTGNVGIGTSIPERKLHISSTTSNFGMLQVEHGSTSPGEASIGFKDRIQADGGQIWVAGVGGWSTDSSFVIGRGAVNFLIDPDGNVGIGTDSPTEKLHVQGEDWATYLAIEGTGGYAPGIKYQMDGSTQWRTLYDPTDSMFCFYRESEGDRLVIKNNGNVGIGTTYPGSARLAVMGGNVGIETYSPSQKLDVDLGNIIVQGTGSCDAPGEEGIVYLGTVHHYIKGVYGFGVKIGTYAVGDVISIKELTGRVGIGTTSPDERLHVDGTVKCDVLKLTGGADIAEPFAVADAPDMQPGMVLTIDPHNCGSLKIAEQPYDRGVAGIVSGAGEIAPGLIMSRSDETAPGEYPVALSGRVYCWADASYGPIGAGDLLTTSDTPGHAMKVSDHVRAQGAIIGKAMSSLEDGKGLVLVLVSLQ